MVYGSQKQFLEIGKDANYLISQTLMHDKINWKVTTGLNRAQVVERYNKLFPNVAYPADFQTALAYSAGAVLEEIIKKANSVDPAKLKMMAVVAFCIAGNFESGAAFHLQFQIESLPLCLDW